MEKTSIHFATGLIKVNEFQSDFYHYLIGETKNYALNVSGPVDSSDMASINQDLDNHKITILEVLKPVESTDYTHIIKDSLGHLYAVSIQVGDWTETCR